MCIKSLFHFHNESLSIWTHLLGFVLFFVLMILTLGGLLEDAKPVDYFVFACFLFSAQLQMIGSTLFHMFGCYSANAYSWLAKLDYCGISILIVGSYYPPLYYCFQCHPAAQISYMTIITVFGAIGVSVSCLQIFSTPRYRVVRAAFFLVFGLFAVIPMPHLLFVNDIVFTQPILWREVLMGTLYVVGALIYASRIPEKWMPGKFDFAGSHVIWHLFTIAAPLVQLSACLVAFEQRKLMPCV